MNEKIGVGITTYNRPEYLKTLLNSLKKRNDLELIIVNDGSNFVIDELDHHVHNNEQNLGVGKSKNIAIKYLLNKNCDHIFLIEDDMIIKNDKVFEKYIEASKESGIQHFNFSQHGYANKGYDPNDRNNLIPMIKLKLNYTPTVNILFYQHCVGSFSYYSRKCLESAGLMDEQYYNACEHVDHTYQIIKAGYHSPFWWFADIDNSWEYIVDHGWSMESSSICSKSDFRSNVEKSDRIFQQKHGCLPAQIPDVGLTDAYKMIKEIKNKYGRSNNNFM